MDDVDAMHAINSDPLVMQYFPSMPTYEQTKELIELIISKQQQVGYSLYAVELKTTSELIGFVGLLYRSKEELDIACMPGTEIGWRLASQYWNQGYATEAASAVLNYAFETLGLDEIVSFTAVPNIPSQRVMQKIGLTRNPADDFAHPKLAKDHWLCQHVLYRLGAPNSCSKTI
jgi:RimJ/RimL family protein N-acetyltransferase